VSVAKYTVWSTIDIATNASTQMPSGGCAMTMIAIANGVYASEPTT